MAEASTVQEVTGYVLHLDVDEAGYLVDLLNGHIGGTIAIDTEPLGRIRLALDNAEVKRLYPIRSKYYGKSGHAVLDSPGYVSPWED